MKRLALSVLVAALPFAVCAQNTTLYKLIHPNGKVEYSEKPPKDFPGKVIPLNVNPDANTATLPKASATGEAGGKRAVNQDARDAGRLTAAREKLDAARAALKDAQDNPSESDVARMGIKGGGTRPVPSDAYKERLERLEQSVKNAEEQVKSLEGKG
jgi:hypothetical protein